MVVPLWPHSRKAALRSDDVCVKSNAALHSRGRGYRIRHGLSPSRSAPCHRHGGPGASGPRLLRGHAGSATDQKDGELRQPPRLPLLLRQRDRHTRDDLDDVPVSRPRRSHRNQGRGPGDAHLFFGTRSVAAVLDDTIAGARHYRRRWDTPLRRVVGHRGGSVRPRDQLVATDRDTRAAWTVEGIPPRPGSAAFTASR